MPSNGIFIRGVDFIIFVFVDFHVSLFPTYFLSNMTMVKTYLSALPIVLSVLDCFRDLTTGRIFKVISSSPASPFFSSSMELGS